MNVKKKINKKKTRTQQRRARKAAEAKFWASVREESEAESVQLEFSFKYDHEPKNRK